MRISILLVVALLGGPNARADTEMYKWKDKDGNVHFSDQPGPGAEKIKVHDVSTMDAQPINPSPPPPPPADFLGYSKFSIVAPENNGVVRDNNGAVTVSVSTEPALRGDLGHTVRVTVGGQVQGGAGTSFNFVGIDRGTHSINAVVLDRDGKPLKTTSSVFTLHKAPVKQKN
jgi:hypothetical protein